MSSLKEKYRRFSQWQQEPFGYHDTADHHGCCNCGNEYENNYCPRCGQKAAYGPITWHSVWQGIMDVWGVGTRSLPYSLWQLIWRPGYLIRDYVSGKRQASFPPVKMLVVVALVLVMVNAFFGVNYNNEASTAAAGTVGNHAYNVWTDAAFEWMTNHIAWTVLIVFSLFIIPVWFLFRQAPRFPQHTLPQGFYIQVFIGVQYLMFLLMMILLFEFIPSLSGNGSEASGFMTLFVLPILLLIDYKQLFGYGWWGTIWRVLLALPLSLLFGKMLQYMAGFVYCLCVNDWHNITLYLMDALGLLALVWLLLEIVHLINSRNLGGSISAKAFVRSTLALAVFVLTIAVARQLGIKTPFDIILRVLDGMFVK